MAHVDAGGRRVGAVRAPGDPAGRSEAEGVVTSSGVPLQPFEDDAACRVLRRARRRRGHGADADGDEKGGQPDEGHGDAAHDCSCRRAGGEG